MRFMFAGEDEPILADTGDGTLACGTGTEKTRPQNDRMKGERSLPSH